jgi:hypothetical protein
VQIVRIGDDGKHEPLVIPDSEKVQVLSAMLQLEMQAGRMWWHRFKKQRIQLWASVLANIAMLAVFWL